MIIFWKRTKVTPNQHSYTLNDSKVTPKCAKWHQNDAKCLQNLHGSLRRSFGWRCLPPLDTTKYVEKMSIFCLWTRLGRTRSDMICITCAIRRLYAAFGIPFFTFRPLSSIIFMKIDPKVTPSWPLRCIKSLKSIGKMSVFQNWTKVTPR